SAFSPPSLKVRIFCFKVATSSVRDRFLAIIAIVSLLNVIRVGNKGLSLVKGWKWCQRANACFNCLCDFFKKKPLLGRSQQGFLNEQCAMILFAEAPLVSNDFPGFFFADGGWNQGYHAGPRTAVFDYPH